MFTNERMIKIKEGKCLCISPHFPATVKMEVPWGNFLRHIDKWGKKRQNNTCSVVSFVLKIPPH